MTYPDAIIAVTNEAQSITPVLQDVTGSTVAAASFRAVIEERDKTLTKTELAIAELTLIIDTVPDAIRSAHGMLCISQLRAALDEKDKEIERLRAAYNEQNFTITRTIGRALGYIEPDGTVNVCDHTAETLAEEVSNRLIQMKKDWSRQSDAQQSVVENFGFEILDSKGEIDSLKAEIADLHAQHDLIAAQIVEADLRGMKYKEEVERLRADCERQVEKHAETITNYAELKKKYRSLKSESDLHFRKLT